MTGQEVVAFACDEAYMMPLATALRSLVDATSSGYRPNIAILTTGVSEESKERVLRSIPAGSANITWLSVDVSAFSGFATQHYISKMTYARLLLPHLVPELCRRVLYLDVDILVLGDVAPLLKADLASFPVGAVEDITSAVSAERLGIRMRPANATGRGGSGIVRGEYFNAGVLLIDVPQWREQKVSERALEYLRVKPGTLFSDQDALNVACAGSWEALDPRWNYQNHFSTRVSTIEAGKRPHIVHFVSFLKPWEPSALSINSALYDSFRTKTSFRRGTCAKVIDGAITLWCRLKRLIRRSAVLQKLKTQIRSRIEQGLRYETRVS